MRRWCIPRWRWYLRPGESWCWAAAMSRAAGDLQVSDGRGRDAGGHRSGDDRAGRPLAAAVRVERGALADPRVTVVNADAYVWLEEPGEAYDAAIVDFPDPNSFSLGKLYTTRFYRLLRQRLQPAAPVAIQCTSPLIARTSYWCIIRTLEAAGFTVRPYHATVPSFGDWGFALARLGACTPPSALPPAVADRLRFLTRRPCGPCSSSPRTCRAWQPT